VSLEHCGIPIKPLLLPGERGGEGEMESRRRVPGLFLMTIPDGWLRGDAGCACLSASERIEMDSMASPRRRAQYAAGRVLLRHALQRELGGSLMQWEIGRGGNGEPRPLRSGCEASASVSHSGAHVVCAVGAKGALGVDIEQCRPRASDWDDLAAAVLHPLERQRLANFPHAGRWRGFHVAWTLKEALGKALGVGLGLDFGSFAFSAEARVVAAPDWFSRMQASWTFATLDLDVDAIAALAWRPH
jgi:4'-phosphopantetheinyl transferase